jgi:PKD repeat protein
MKHTLKLSLAITLLLIIAQIMSCKEDNADTEVISSFTYSIDTMNFKKADFKSYANYYKSLTWNFGDNSAASSEKTPSHIYEYWGVYFVTLTATASDGTATDVYSDSVYVTNPLKSNFTFKVDSADFKKIFFTSTSKHYTTLAWDFGDSSATSTEANPIHIYPALGTYTVILTATDADGATNACSKNLNINNLNAELTKLVGEVSKTWKLIHTVTPGVYPLEVGPYDRSMIWWAVGLNNNELAGRPCMWNDEWTFSRNGTLEFDAKGDFWREGDIFPNANVCGSTNDMLNSKGEDCSAWGSGTHQFELVSEMSLRLKALGKGAFIGFFKSATNIEVTKLTPMVQDSVVYDVVKLTEGTIDTLVVEANYKFEVGDPNFGGYWRYVLVHYDNPDDEPPLPGN